MAGLVALSMLLCFVLALAGCGTPADSMQPLPPVASHDYRLGPGDQVRIITFGEEQLSGEFRVDASGDIALPLVGNIHAAGLTGAQLQEKTSKILRDSKQFRDPHIAVEVTSYRPVFILGEVNKPGQYPYQPDMTVITAVAVAGGFTYRAVRNVFSVVRTDNDTTIEGRAVRQDPVEPGDVITVYERRF